MKRFGTIEIVLGCFDEMRFFDVVGMVPIGCVVDSQSVRTGKMGGVRGYDGGKHIKGRKRHTAVDTLGCHYYGCQRS